MNELTSNLSNEIEAIKRAFAAINRNDIAGFMSLCDEQIERIEPADFPMAGTYIGLRAVAEHLSKGRGSWAEGSCEPHRFTVVGTNCVIAHVQVRVRLKSESTWREGRIADAFTFRDGRFIQFRTFGSDEQALEWAAVR